GDQADFGGHAVPLSQVFRRTLGVERRRAMGGGLPQDPVCIPFRSRDCHMRPMALPPQPWPTGHCERLEPLVRRVLAPNGSPFTYTGTQTYLVGTDEGLAVIDPGPALPEHLAALEACIGWARVVAICCTHTHRD